MYSKEKFRSGKHYGEEGIGQVGKDSLMIVEVRDWNGIDRK